MTTPSTLSSGLGPSLVRTFVPLLVGYVVSFAARKGFEINDDNAAALITAVSGYAYYVIARLLELKAPQLGYLLGVAKAPAYSNEPAPSPGPGEDVVVEVVPEGQ